MKQFNSLLFATISLLIISCNNAANIDKNDICGKEFTQTVQDPMYADVSTTATTVFQCNGTFISDEAGNISDPSPSHPVNFSNPHFTGKWEIVQDIPDNVKQAVIAYGLEENDHNYSIIKYFSSNGISGYCLYHIIESKGSVSALNTGQVSQYDWGHVSGAAGIFDGFSKN